MRKLAEQAKQGNPDAFVKLVELQKKDLYKVARGFFQNEEDIADAIQETVLCCYEHIGELKQPEYVQTWTGRGMGGRRSAVSVMCGFSEGGS